MFMSVLLGAALAMATVFSAASCAGDAHEHTLRQMKAKEATCFEDGNLAYWECTECKRLFADAEGTEEVTADLKARLQALQEQYGDPVRFGSEHDKEMPR